LKPEAGTNVKSGMPQEITWNTSISDEVRIEYSIIGHNDWYSIANGVQSSLQRYVWNVPEQLSGTFRIRIVEQSGLNSIVSQTSPFVIEATTTDVKENTSGISWINVPNVVDITKNLNAQLNVDIVELALINMQGQKVLINEITYGNRNADISLQSITKGVYILIGVNEIGKTYSKTILIR
jgi:hypothetical protein